MEKELSEEDEGFDNRGFWLAESVKEIERLEDEMYAEEMKSLACPFCGATPHHGLGKVQHCQLHGEPFQDFSIWCPSGCAKITRRNEKIARLVWNTRATPKELTAAKATIERLVGALEKIMPIRINDGRDYAEVVFSDGSTHSTQAMTMNPQDWRDISDAFQAIKDQQ